MLMCRDLVRQADAYIAGELPRMQRWMFRMHLAMCRHCSRFMRQFRLLLQFLPHLEREADDRTVERIMTAIHEHEQQPK